MLGDTRTIAESYEIPVLASQGISAASLARPVPLPWFDNDAVAADFDLDLDNVNLEEVFETMILSLENELTVASEQKGTRNIIACGVSITNVSTVSRRTLIQT